MHNCLAITGSCDVAGIPGSFGVLSVVRWSGVAAVSAAYLGDNTCRLPAMPRSHGRLSTTRYDFHCDAD